MKIEKVLLVDDDPNIRRLATISLERVGKWQVVAATSGAEALSLLPAFGPDLVILDVMMPKLDGISTLKKLRSIPEWERLPVILMTAKIQPTELEAYMNTGVMGVIVKPFDAMTLPQQLQKLLAGVAVQE